MAGYPKALILAGGAGTRLRRLGMVLPKCFAPVFDEPLLVRQVVQCGHAGARDVYISISKRYAPVLAEFIHLFAERAEEMGKSRKIPTINLHVLTEEEPLGAVQGLIEASEAINDSPAIIMLGDEYFEHNSGFERLKILERKEKIILNAVETANQNRIQCNIAMDEDGQIMAIRDKPAPEKIVGKTRWEGLIAVQKGFQDMAEEAKKGGLVAGSHLGDLLDGFRKLGVPMGVEWFEERCVNLNSPEDVLMSSLVTAEKYWKRERPEETDRLSDRASALYEMLESFR